MENVTHDRWTDYIHFVDYKVLMWKFCPPFILVLGTFGNLATILVMSRIKDNNSSQYVILMVLAMADMCVLYSGLLSRWLRYAFRMRISRSHTAMCKLLSWTLYASNTTSAWLVTTVTVQRTMAVLWPHRMRMMCTVRRTWVVIAVVVVTTCSMHLHVIIGFQLIGKHYCYFTGEYKRFLLFIWKWVDMCVSSVGPSICLLVGSVILSSTLFSSANLSSAAIHTTSNADTGHSQNNRKSDVVKVTVRVLALSCTFLFLTLPICIFNTWYTYGYVHTPKTAALSLFLESLLSLMCYSNSAVNFLLYCITGARFRKEFLSLLCCGAKGRSVGETTAVTSSGGGRKRQNGTPLSA